MRICCGTHHNAHCVGQECWGPTCTCDLGPSLGAAPHAHDIGHSDSESSTSALAAEEMHPFILCRYNISACADTVPCILLRITPLCSHALRCSLSEIINLPYVACQRHHASVYGQLQPDNVGFRDQDLGLMLGSCTTSWTLPSLGAAADSHDDAASDSIFIRLI